MSRARQTPIESVGGVDIYAPPSSGRSPYYRMKWIEPSGFRGDTSGGKSLEEARGKAIPIAQRLERAASAFAVATLLQLIDDYIAGGRSPYSGETWKQGYRKQTEDQLRRSVRAYGDRCAMDVDRTLLDLMRAQAGTDRMVRQNTTALRGLLNWGYRHPQKYFTIEQAELLPRGCLNPIPTLATGRTMPKRKVRTRAVGQHEDYIQDADAPDADQVRGLAVELGLEFPTWGQLAVEMAVNLGFRWGEQFQLTVDDVHLDGCRLLQDIPHVHIDLQIDAGSSAGDGSRVGRLSPPKGYKTRVVGVPEVSFTGFPLLEVLTARTAAAVAEQAAGRNDDALLHPAKQGGMHWHSSFSADYLHPAMQAAGWPTTLWNDGKSDRTVYHLTWHSLRHRFARNAVDIDKLEERELMQAGGWENIATVQNRYYRSGDDSRRSAAEKMTRRGKAA